MTLTVTQGWDYRMNRYISGAEPCKGPDEYYTNFQLWQKAVEDQPEAHRDFPDKPYWLHPTQQIKQYTEEQRYGIYKHGPVLYQTWWCNGVPLKRYSTTWNGVAPGTKESYPTTTNWQLGVRLKIKDEVVNLGATLVEYRETANMLLHFAKGVKGAWDIFHGRLPKNRKRLTPCDIAAAQLGYSYGVAPLASDLFDSALALTSRLDKPIYRRVVSRDVISGKVDAYDKKGSWQVSDRAICYVQLDPNRVSFSLGNPLENAWEGIPFSFVVDWGIGVGDWLSSLDALKDVKSVIGTVTKKQRYFHRYDKPLGAEDEWITSKPFVRYRSHERAVVNSVPLPGPPRWDPSRSWRTIQNALSLLTVVNQRCK